MDVDSVTVPADIELLLRSYPSLQYVPDKNRVKCTWTEHEMPARLSSIENYVKGKKYQQFLKKKLDNDYLGKYKMFLEPSHKKDHERQLFCKLTWRHLNKEPHHILRHLQGKRFQRALTLWQECQANNTEYVPIGRKKKQKPTNASKEDGGTANDDDEYTDLSEDEIYIENDDPNDDLSDLYPDFRRLRANDADEATANGNDLTNDDVNVDTNKNGDDENTSYTNKNVKNKKKRKAQASEIKKPKKLAPSTKRLRGSSEIEPQEKMNKEPAMLTVII